MPTSQKLLDLRKSRLEKGLCQLCGNNPYSPGLLSCNVCLHKMSKSRRKLKDSRDLDGLCIRCGAPALEGFRNCLKCKEKDSGTKKKRKDKNLCVACGGEKQSNTELCEECKEYRRVKKKLNIEIREQENLCITCGGQRDSEFKSCSLCRDKSKKLSKNLRVLVVNHYGGICNCCKESNLNRLTMDHINNDGAEHRREIGASNFYRWLKNNNFPEGFQVLCWNCNFCKYLEVECNH